jgi:outer membrane protein
MHRMRLWWVGIFAAAGLGAAQASDIKGPPPALAPGAASMWTVTLGAEGRMTPTYPGSDRYTIVPLPLFDLRKVGTPRRFRSPRDGFGVPILDSGRFRAGPAIKLRMPRRESADSDLNGLGDVDLAVEVGGFIELWPTEWLRTRAELRQGFGGHHGVVGDVMADVVMPVTPQLTLSGGPRATIMTGKALEPYFSVDAAQSAASGLPVYSAGSGVYSVGAGAQLRYQWTPQWATHVFLEYERLTGDAADSPIVMQRGSRDQWQAGLGATYSFDMPALW